MLTIFVPHESHIVDLTAETLTRTTPVTGLRDCRVKAATEANIRHARQHSANAVIRSEIAKWGFRHVNPIALNNTHTGLTVEEKKRREFI